MSPKMVDMELTIDDVARSVSLELTTTDEKSSWYPK
jgi:polyisoprenoid-binding protein YceI